METLHVDIRSPDKSSSYTSICQILLQNLGTQSSMHNIPLQKILHSNLQTLGKGSNNFYLILIPTTTKR